MIVVGGTCINGGTCQDLDVTYYYVYFVVFYMLAALLIVIICMFYFRAPLF